MTLAVIVAEKTSSIDREKVLELLEAISLASISSGLKLAVVFYGEKAVPILDPTPVAPEFLGELTEIYESTPDLGKSPRLEEALSETLDLILEYREEARGARVPVIWSASVRPSRLADMLLETIESLDSKVSIVIPRPSPPGWLRHHPALAAKVRTVRVNTNLAKVAEKLLFEA